MPDDRVIAAAQALWRAHGAPAGAIRVMPCTAGGNSRVLILEAGGERVVAKGYFRDAPDGRKRLDAERAFLEYAQRIGIACVPRPIAADEAELVALHGFVSGRPLAPAEITRLPVLAAADFIVALNRPDHAALARGLPDAAEAAFSISGHFAVVERRLARLDAIPADDGTDRAAGAFVVRLRDFWARARGRIAAGAARENLNPDAELSDDLRLISPSDFGFHNALAAPDGSLTFVDFEYAGRDDISKLVSDFFFQPKVPVPGDLFLPFAERICVGTGRDFPNSLRWIGLLRPVFGVKWCCILLNCFLPQMMARRRFVHPACGADDPKRIQLEKAETALRKLEDMPWPI